MGQEIVYCAQCQRRVTGAEFDRGQAFQIGNHLVCSTCAAALLPTLDLEDRERLLKQMFKATRDRRSTSTASLPSVRAPLAADRSAASRKTTRTIPVVKPPSTASVRAVRPNPVPTFLLATVIGAACLLFILWVGSGKSASKAPDAEEMTATRVPRKPPPPPTPDLPAPDPRETAARDAIHRAEVFQERSADDLDGIVRQWESAAKAADRTSLGADARSRLATAQRRRQESFDRELSALDEKARSFFGKNEYKPAWDVYKSASTRHDHPDWEFAIEKRIRETYQAVSRQLTPLKSQAAAAARKKDSAALRDVRERVIAWGFPELVAELDRAIATAATEASPDPGADAGPPWTSILKGRWIDELIKANCGWKMEDGALVSFGESVRSARTWTDYASGEFRIRFEILGTTYVFFNIRQGAEGHYEIALNKHALSELPPGEHVLVITFREGPVTATLDGAPLPVINDRSPRTGALQFSPSRGRLKVTSIEYRP
jgi:hypothetical protein